MFLSRLSLTEEAIKTPEFWCSFTSEYRLHRTAWTLFGDHANRRRDFLYRLDSDQGRPLLWTLSDREPLAPSELWRIETKRVEPKLQAGEILEFDVRVNPVVSRAGRRHDVVMDHKHQTGWKSMRPTERETEAVVVQKALTRWLDARTERLGVTVHRLLADGYRVARFQKPSGKEVQLGLCDLSGLIEVTDPERFLAVWRAGLGPAKAFGCGLLLIRRNRS